MNEPETRNGLVYKVAERARELANEPITALRRRLASMEAHTEHAMQKESAGKSRGELIEELLTEEFVEEFDTSFQQDE